MKLTLITFACLLTCVYGVVVDVDTSESPDLERFGYRVKTTLEDYYPTVAKLLRSPKFKDAPRIHIFFDPDHTGIAKAIPSERRIVASVNHYRSDQGNIGSMVHELAHVVQNYHRSCPSWIWEGVADWVRYYHFEPNRRPNKPGPEKKYTDGYAVSAYFLNWINGKRSDMIYYINKDCREGTYRDAIFPKLMGKTVTQLWKEMMD